MYRISIERPCSKSITTTYIIFNREHAGVTHVNMCEFRGNQRIFTEVIVRTDRETDRQTEVINTFQLSLERVKKVTIFAFYNLHSRPLDIRGQNAFVAI